MENRSTRKVSLVDPVGLVDLVEGAPEKSTDGDGGWCES